MNKKSLSRITYFLYVKSFLCFQLKLMDEVLNLGGLDRSPSLTPTASLRPVARDRDVEFQSRGLTALLQRLLANDDTSGRRRGTLRLETMPIYKEGPDD